MSKIGYWIKKYKTDYHEYIFEFPYRPEVVAQVKAIQDKFGWEQLSFHKGEEIGWIFSSKDVYNMIRTVFEPRVEKEVEDEFSGASQVKFELPERDLEPIEINTLLPLYPFQRQAVDFCVRVGGRALLAMDMGTGKTAVSIGYGVHRKYQDVLVVCPAFLKQNWQREIKQFAGIDAKILTTEDPGRWEIIGYPNLERYLGYLLTRKYDLIIFDESHYIKNKSAKRTKAAFKVAVQAKDALFLSGTPIMNRPAEIYTVHNFMKRTSFWDFANKYCGMTKTNFGYDFTGATNLAQLKEEMSYMHRKTKAEVLTELPDKTINLIETKMDDWKEYHEIQSDYRAWLEANDLNLSATFAEALTKASYLKQCVVRHKNIKEIIDDFLENDKKIIVFSQYKETIHYLQKIYEKISVSLTGETPVDERQSIVDQFQQDEGVRIFFSTMRAGGVGLTLTAADTVIFTDLDWTPATHAQAEDRAYRIGQKNNVNVYYLVTPDTLEEDIWAMLKRKEKMVNKILAGEENVRKVHLKSILKKI
jgi:SWI/SNF-related matrix-associated actin-dependent regulator 1 of chromatin subfamily A